MIMILRDLTTESAISGLLDSEIMYCFPHAPQGNKLRFFWNNETRNSTDEDKLDYLTVLIMNRPETVSSF